MIHRKTQNADYWQAFSLIPEDLEFLRNLFLDAERPLTGHELALALVTERCRREEAALRVDLARGTMYQPKKRFVKGDKVIFPALDFRIGEVIAVRPGENPEHGEFDVMTVDFGQGRRQRDFAAALAASHKLNVDIPDLLVAGDLASPERLLDSVAADIPDALTRALAGKAEFSRFEDRWLLRDLMTEVHIGHLNITEAVIEMRGAPVDIDELQRELDLPSEVGSEVVQFSLQSAMVADGRFDEVGTANARRWFLRRLESSEALVVPQPLEYTPVEVGSLAAPPSLLRLARELDDEWSEESSDDSALRESLTTATVLLTYPHAVSGTLPLNRRARPFFPRGHGERTMVTLVDGRWGNRFPAWAVHAGRYVAGLGGWLEKHKLPAGAFITLERRDDSGEIVVDFRPKRMRREWTRWAQLTEDGRLDIQLRKQEIACEYDEQIVIGDDRGENVSRLRTSPSYRQKPLEDLVFEVFTDLAGLSGTGSVHAKTVYSAVNVIRRCPPEPIFAALAADSRLEPVDNNSFRLVADAI